MAPIRVLIVDDNPSFLNSAARYLSTCEGLEVVGNARSGQEALARVAAVHPDLVLMDLVMPGVNGLQATQMLKAEPGSPRVILISLHSDIRYRAATVEAGADGFLSKSDLIRGLGPLLQQLFGRDEDGTVAHDRNEVIREQERNK